MRAAAHDGPRVALSVDMEAISQITDPRQVLACCAEYWDVGRHLLTDEVVAAASGLLDGGATEVVVLDNHGSGNPWNVIRDRLPAGVLPVDRHVFDLPAAGIDGMFQLGYHPRAGVAGFIPHTYVPRLQLSVDGEPIGESEGRAWAADTRLLGIVGHAAHGPRFGAPFLAVQDGGTPTDARPRHPDPAGGLADIRGFARECVQTLDAAPRPRPPRDARLEARIDDPTAAEVARMTAAGWVPAGDGFTADIATWADARPLLDAAMAAAMTPFGAAFAGLDLTSRAALGAQDPARLRAAEGLFLGWLRAVTPANSGARSGPSLHATAPPGVHGPGAARVPLSRRR